VTIEITVREYARLTTHEVSEPTLDRAQISKSAFDWLCELSATFGRSGASLLEVEGRRWLRLDSYVGVIETPCGTRLEILPKHMGEGDCIASSRRLLRQMISSAMDLPVRVANETSLQLFDAPLSEWVIGQFLSALDHLIKRGVRSDYVRIESSERYLRGQLDVVRQMRQPPGRAHIFQIRHDVFLPDRPENRLLKSALTLVCKRTQLPENWRLAQELRTLFHEVAGSTDFASDFKKWGTDRLMAHYQPIRSWCELILYRQMPFSVVGDWHGISMLFPMEKLFERYVTAALRTMIASETSLKTQASSQSLCTHQKRPMFRLEPDILIEQGLLRWVLDTKWKRINQHLVEKNYEISQSDFYQMFAYGQRYLGGKGDMALIYPMHQHFSAPLSAFQFDSNLRLWAIPFDLDNRCLLIPSIHEVSSDGEGDPFACLKSTKKAGGYEGSIAERFQKFA
jgi:5-methylcytosine-specific restriction enzyme subunit McrC